MPRFGPRTPRTLIIPFPAGGAMDLLGRAVARDLTDKLGQPFMVDNRVGAAGNIGAMAVAKAAPDGLHDPDGRRVLAGAEQVHVRGHAVRSGEGAGAPIVIISKLQHILVVNPKVEAKTLKELVDYARANPGRLNAGVPGAGTTAHITLEAFMAQTGAKMTMVTYRAEPRDAHRSRRRPARFRLHLDDKPGAARSRPDACTRSP